MLVKTYGAAVQGIDAVVITIEVNVNRGTKFFLVGLPDNAVKESHERINSAINYIGYRFPRQQVTINMAPADIKKEGAAYDLPLAIGIMAASEQINTQELDKYIIMGEVSLDGSLKPVKGVLPIALMAQQQGFKGCILPYDNAREAAVVQGIEVYGMNNLNDVIDFFNNKRTFDPVYVDAQAEFLFQTHIPDLDFADVKGQDNVKRALEVAAAGGHNIIMVGPPGAGKSMLAKRLSSILPPLTLQEALETTKIHSVAGILDRSTSLVAHRPFRSPHHTISDIALVGGGTNPQPGEISLAHNGVLFLDELPEYKRSALEVMRQPLEDRKICISRAKNTVEYPASFMLVAAMNPCPCGHYGDPYHACTCTPTQVHNYLNRISGPLLDRIDMQIEIQPLPFEQLSKTQPGEPSAIIRERVIKAREIQQKRYKDIPNVYCNAQMTPKMMRQYTQIDDASLAILRQAMERMHLSARAYDRILKVARTIADLDGSPAIQLNHIGEAVSYRNLDRETWGG